MIVDYMLEYFGFVMKVVNRGDRSDIEGSKFKGGGGVCGRARIYFDITGEEQEA